MLLKKTYGDYQFINTEDGIRHFINWADKNFATEGVDYNESIEELESRNLLK